MKKSFLSILCTAYCNTIMPQIGNNVDNICNTVIMKVVIICMKSSFKKRLITVPVSRFYHTIIISPSTILTMTGWVAFTHCRIVNCFFLRIVTKNGTRRSVWTFLCSHHIHALTLLSLFCSHVFSVGRKIHTWYIKKKKTNDDKHRREVQASSSAFCMTPPTLQPFLSPVSISLCCRFLSLSAFLNHSVSFV